MDTLIKNIISKCQQIIDEFQSASRSKLLAMILMHSFDIIKKSIAKNGGNLKKNLKNISEATANTYKYTEILTNFGFFDIFGQYSKNHKYIEVILDENRHINGYLAEILSEKAKEELIMPNFEDFRLIDEVLENIDLLSFKKYYKNFNKIGQEYTYVFLGLIFDIKDNEEEEKKVDLPARKKIDVPASFDLPMNFQKFKEMFTHFIDKMKFNRDLCSEENLQNIKSKFPNQENIELEELDEFFRTFRPFEDRKIHLKFLKNSKENESMSLKIYRNYFTVNDSQKPLQDSYKIVFGREVQNVTDKADFLLGKKVQNSTDRADFFLGSSLEISKKQFELKFMKNGATVKCLSTNYNTCFLITNDPFPLSKFNNIIFGENHCFYVRETEKSPLVSPDEAFDGGPYLALKGIGNNQSSEHVGEKFLIKTEGCSFDEESDDFDMIKTVKKGEGFVFGSDLKFKDPSILEKHAKIWYDKKTRNWLIASGAENEQQWFQAKTRIAVVKFDETKEGNVCSPKEVKEGNILNVEEFFIQVTKIK